MSYFAKYFHRNIYDVRTFQVKLIYTTDKNIINNQMSKRRGLSKNETSKYDKNKRQLYQKDLVKNTKNYVNVKNFRYQSNKLFTNVSSCTSAFFTTNDDKSKVFHFKNDIKSQGSSASLTSDKFMKKSFRTSDLSEKKRKPEKNTSSKIETENVQVKKHKINKDYIKTGIFNECSFTKTCINETSSNSNDIINDFNQLSKSYTERYINKDLKTDKENNLINHYCSNRTMNQIQLQRSFSDSLVQNSWCLNPNTDLFTNLYEPICQVPVTQFVYHKKNKITYKNKTMSANDISSLTNNYIENIHTEMDRLKEFRKWRNTKLGDFLKGSNVSSTKIGFIFTLMSYNVLAQVLLTEHSYLYRNHDPRALFWDHRKWALMREIQEHDADILCLQEVEKTHLDSFYSQFHDLGYRGIFKQRTGIRIDGCALYYKYEKFDLIEYTTVEYYQPHINVLDRENVAIVARFNVKNSPEKQFVVATTHLLYNPKRQDIRLAQTQVLLAEIDRIAFESFDINGKPIYVPIILTGDFNLEPYTPVYNLLVRGKFRYEGLAARSLQAPGTSRSGLYTNKILLPKRLRITDNCQHADIVKQRYEGKQKINRNDELNLIKLQHSERSVQLEVPNSAVTKSHKILNNTQENYLFSSGTLTHGLNLKSVYDHFTVDGYTEATTNQYEWITVDYIFYSLIHNDYDNSNVEGKLQLVSRYEIPSVNNCKKFPYLPNLVLGSDHLALLSKFLLK